jgi:hypothetical protein
MPTLKEAANDFLAQKRIAVAGVSRTPAGHGANVVYTGLRRQGIRSSPSILTRIRLREIPATTTSSPSQAVWTRL